MDSSGKLRYNSWHKQFLSCWTRQVKFPNLGRKPYKKVMIKIDTDGNELDVLNGFIETFKGGSIVTVLVETHPTNRNEIESFFRRLDFREDEIYLSVEGHSNYRREAKGNGERTKVYVCPMV